MTAPQVDPALTEMMDAVFAEKRNSDTHSRVPVFDADLWHQLD